MKSEKNHTEPLVTKKFVFSLCKLDLEADKNQLKASRSSKGRQQQLLLDRMPGVFRNYAALGDAELYFPIDDAGKKCFVVRDKAADELISACISFFTKCGRTKAYPEDPPKDDPIVHGNYQGISLLYIAYM